MATKPSKLRRVALLATAGLSACGLLIATTQSGSAAPAGRQARAATVKPVVPGSYYLALGDSISFGYRESQNLPTPNYNKPASFVGFPEDVGANLGLKVENLACPGETSASLVDNTKQSYGCEGPQGYRTNFPLHKKYSKSQLAAGIAFLKSHKNTRLVTLMVGANDGFLCQATTADHCTSQDEFLGVLQTIQKNVVKIMKGLRNTAKYTGQIVIVNYYSTDYTSAMTNTQVKAINSDLDNAAHPYHVKVARTYGRFKIAAAQSSGDPCAAGLLTILQNAATPCGVHPSVGGQSLIAAGVEHNTKKA